MANHILFDEKICVRCGACVSESEFGGVIFKDGKILFDETKTENWTEIISICPTGALKSTQKIFTINNGTLIRI